MHQQAYNFVARAVAGKDFREQRVLELGSLNINGSVRALFGAAEYYGIDIRNGPGVDEVASATGYDGKERYDVVVTTEAMEHADTPSSFITAARKALKPGGLLIITAAAPEREAHSWNGGPLRKDERYAAISVDDLTKWLEGWERVKIVHDPEAGDVYAVATKPADVPVDDETKPHRVKAK